MSHEVAPPEIRPYRSDEAATIQRVFERQEGNLNPLYWNKLRGRTHAEDGREIEQELDQLLGILGVDPTRWADLYVYRSERYVWEDVFTEHKAMLRRDPRPLGRYLIDCAYDELTIEDEEDGDVTVRVELHLPNDKGLTFNLTGQHWTDRWYPQVSEDDPRPEEELCDEECISEVGYEIVIEAFAEKPRVPGSPGRSQ
jgi:hypothetical protein